MGTCITDPVFNAGRLPPPILPRLVQYTFFESIARHAGADRFEASVVGEPPFTDPCITVPSLFELPCASNVPQLTQ
jgi:hypothetical protein